MHCCTTPSWDDATLAAAYENMLGALPATHRRLGFEAMRQQMPEPVRSMQPPFDEAVPVPADASAIDRLVAWNGRQPEWRPDVLAVGVAVDADSISA